MSKKIIFKILLCLSCSSLLTACTAKDSFRGYTFEDQDINIIKIGKTTEADLLERMGSPTSISDFGAKTYYYIAVKQSQTAFWHPKIVTQNVMEIVFDRKNKVSDIHMYSLEEGNKIEYDLETTRLKGNERGSIQHIFDNIGKFNASLPKR